LKNAKCVSKNAMTRWIVPRGENGDRRCYHTDLECPYISDAETREATENEIDWYDLEQCSWCEDGPPGNDGTQSGWHKFNRNLRHNNDCLDS